jgi:methylglutaconyl-CoA hydratase
LHNLIDLRKHWSMEEYQTISVKPEGKTLNLWLNRSEVHNALNREMIVELHRFFQWAEEQPHFRFVVIRGHGKSFCAGADLNWMKESANLSDAENLDDSRLLTQMLMAIYRSSKVVIGAAYGNIFGGGTGLLAACDMAYTVTRARFSLSETRLGLVAASITPLLLKRMKSSRLKELIFSGSHFNGTEAFENGLADRVFESVEEMDRYILQLLEQMLKGGPRAVVRSKQLINELTDGTSMDEYMKQMPELLAEVRVTPEAQEGITAFLEKRTPDWP